MSGIKVIEELKLEILDKFKGEVEALTERIAAVLENEIDDVLKSNEVSASGGLRKSIKAKVEKLRGAYVIEAFSDKDYATYVHDGTKPHFPPVKAIEKWVKRKGLAAKVKGTAKSGLVHKGKTQSTETALAWAIAKKIARKGTKGIKFFDLALKQALPKIENEVLKMMRTA